MPLGVFARVGLGLLRGLRERHFAGKVYAFRPDGTAVPGWPVLVIDPSAPDQPPPTLHPAFAPAGIVHPGDPLTFKVRAFRTTYGNETWDFGDGTENVTVRAALVSRLMSATACAPPGSVDWKASTSSGEGEEVVSGPSSAPG